MKHVRNISKKPAGADAWTDVISPILGIVVTIASAAVPIVQIIIAIKQGTSGGSNSTSE